MTLVASLMGSEIGDGIAIPRTLNNLPINLNISSRIAFMIIFIMPATFLAILLTVAPMSTTRFLTGSINPKAVDSNELTNFMKLLIAA